MSAEGVPGAGGSGDQGVPELAPVVTLPPPVEAAPQEVEALARLLESHRLAVVTGAGMSTASGIPDYRGPDGVRRVQPMTIGDFRAGPESRRRYWARASWAGSGSPGRSRTRGTASWRRCRPRAWPPVRWQASPG
ncbi:hypothetical protein BJF82_02575 [Kytococcus sp. CUA-901]|nr:hypothetical protein BJF82_02575 [Kytococcus sp. CUA-901]